MSDHLLVTHRLRPALKRESRKKSLNLIFGVMLVPETHNDELLMAAFQAGEEWAFTNIYKRYCRPLLFTLERLTGHKEASEDIVADSFVKLLKKPADFESLNKIRSFLFTIAHNAGLDWLRAEKRHRASHAELGYLSADSEDEIERTLIRTQVLQTLYEEIETLPSSYGEIIKRSFIEGQSLSQIAEQMGLAYKTIQNLKAKAVQQLRIQLLNREFPDMTVLVLFSLMFPDLAPISFSD